MLLASIPLIIAVAKSYLFDTETVEKIRQQTEQEVQRPRESNQNQDLRIKPEFVLVP